MNATLTYREPYRFSAGMLALVVHLAFFILLYFGVRWQSHPPETLMVEMWDSLPNTEADPEQKPISPVKTEPKSLPKVVVPALPPVKADIEVRDKKIKKVEAKEKPVKKNDAKEKALAKAKREAEDQELEAYDRNKVAEQNRRIQAEQARVRAEVNAATQVQVERYQDKIRDKIRRRIKAVTDVPEYAEAIFKVTLLPDGMLMDNPRLVKSSGIRAYDEAVERAILSAEPLPVPPDASLQKQFRELTLKFKPE